VTFGDVLFATNKAELKSSGLVNINKLAQFLQENPDRKVIVEGYTDSTGSASYNQSCPSVARLRFSGADQDGRRSFAHRAQGYGKEYPVADNGSVSGRAMNRRVEVTISNDNQPVMPRSAVSSELSNTRNKPRLSDQAGLFLKIKRSQPAAAPTGIVFQCRMPKAAIFCV
jgi:hypothetical protein